VDWHQATAIPGPGAPKTDAARKGRDTGFLQDAWFTLTRLSAIVLRSFQLFLSGPVSTPAFVAEITPKDYQNDGFATAAG
jgi:hypothetical protein